MFVQLIGLNFQDTLMNSYIANVQLSMKNANVQLSMKNVCLEILEVLEDVEFKGGGGCPVGRFWVKVMKNGGQVLRTMCRILIKPV